MVYNSGMSNLEQIQRGWQRMAENRIRCAQQEGKFDELPGLGKPLEEIMDIDDPYGWVKRTVKKSVRGSSANAIPPPGEPPQRLSKSG